MKSTTKYKYINLIDFDNTIYRGNSAIDFFICCIKLKPLLIFYCFIQFAHLILYVLKFEDRDKFKSRFFGFTKYIANDLDRYVDYFWEKNKAKIKKWYLSRNDRSKDVIVSASPSFYLNKLMKLELNIKELICTEIDIKTGNIIGKNCYGKEKVVRVLSKYPKIVIEEAYSDSMSDYPILTMAKKSFLVKGEKINLI